MRCRARRVEKECQAAIFQIDGMHPPNEFVRLLFHAGRLMLARDDACAGCLQARVVFRVPPASGGSRHDGAFLTP